MADYEKTIQALEEMLERSKDADESGWNPIADTKTIESVLELLKAKESHCLTLDELRKVKPGTVLWRDDIDICAVVPVEYIKIDKHTFNDGVTADMVFFDAGMDYVCDYGVEYRLWTAKPSEEQRKGVQWNG